MCFCFFLVTAVAVNLKIMLSGSNSHRIPTSQTLSQGPGQLQFCAAPPIPAIDGDYPLTPAPSAAPPLTAAARSALCERRELAAKVGGLYTECGTVPVPRRVAVAASHAQQLT